MTRRAEKTLKLDEIGYWSEIKLDIIREYARAYSRILTAQDRPKLYHVYIDAFAGAGLHLSKSRGAAIPGSPQVAVATEPPFREYHFIDLDGSKIASLRRLFAGQSNVHIYEGDCNRIMLEQVFPEVRFEQYRRGLCLLDPYGLHLDWEVIRTAVQTKTMDVFLNFPIMDMNMNVLWKNSEGVSAENIGRMNAFWGDDSWRKAAYRMEPTLFEPVEEKNDNETIAAAFRERLKRVAGFSNVPPPIPMRNTLGRTVYYLYFASQKPVAANIVSHIFDKYRNRGVLSLKPTGVDSCFRVWTCLTNTDRVAEKGTKPMSEHSDIEWTDATWNPVRGCTKITPGCDHCYAETFAERFRGVPGHPYEQGFDLRLVPGKLAEPLRWKTPKMIFVNSMSDLFHKDVPDEYVEAVCRTMERANWHTYQVLTKRSSRLRNMLQTRLQFAACLPHIWWGVSVEDRAHGLVRVDHLREAPAAVRFLSIEPLLEDLGEVNLEGIHWVIVAARAGPVRGRCIRNGFCRSGISATGQTCRSSSSNGEASGRARPAANWMVGPTMGFPAVSSFRCWRAAGE